MQLFERIHGAAGLKIIIGAAAFYAWLDALFMSVFFVRPESLGFMAEMAPILVFLLAAFGLLLSIMKRSLVERVLSSKRILLAFAALGSVGSLLLLFSSINLSWVLLVAGIFCGGLYFFTFQMGWGATFCYRGTKTATPYVAGGFACAIIIDTPLLFMIPEASAVFFALLPLISGLLFISINPEQRSYRKVSSTVPRIEGVGARLKSYLGISITLLGAVVFVMIGFGYMQHLVSFSSFAVGDVTGGILIQVVRGVTAILMFVVIVVFSGRASIVYRVGLLAMIAGFMLMSFLFGTDLFWVSGAVIICGYTAFDLLIWVAFSQIAYAHSREPLKTIAVVRLIAVLSCVAGGLIGIMLVGNGDQLSQFVSAETTIVGYLVVIATVLVLSSEDIWVLFGRGQTYAGPASAGDERAGLDERLEAWFAEFNLTSREKEIATLLAYGRTQPWIAENLTISENTVGTHVRHIYQKMDVHDRQEFIDAVCAPGASPASTSTPATTQNVTSSAGSEGGRPASTASGSAGFSAAPSPGSSASTLFDGPSPESRDVEISSPKTPDITK